MNEAATVPGWYFLLWFAVHYPDGIPAGWRRGLRRVLPLFLVGAVVGVAMHVASALGRITPDAAGSAYLVYVGAAGPLTLVAFWDGWRRSSGVSRQRFTWLLGGFALFLVVSYSTWLNWLVIGANQQYVNLVAVLGSLAMYVGLSYAILRHRVLDMGLAVNRSLVFAVVGAVLLGTFQLLQVVTARLLHFDDPAKAGLLSGVLAVLVVLAYPKVKPRAEWLIDRLFFRDWVAREADLARFAADAGLHRSVVAGHGPGRRRRSVHRRSGATLYVRGGDGRFERQEASTAGAPQTDAPQCWTPTTAWPWPCAQDVRWRAATKCIRRCRANWPWSCPVSASSTPSSWSAAARRQRVALRRGGGAARGAAIGRRRMAGLALGGAAA